MAKAGKDIHQDALSDDALLAALGIDLDAPSPTGHTALEERLIAGFEDIVRFHQTYGRAPQAGENRNIFERLYALRLEQLRQSPQARELLAARDAPGLLDTSAPALDVIHLDKDALLAELGMDPPPVDAGDIHDLRHVRPRSNRQAAQDVAERTTCTDFDWFAPQFEQVQRELKAGLRKTPRFGRDTRIEVGHWFIVGGQLACVVEMGDTFTAPNGKPDARLRVIYDNGTESNLRRLSLQRALYKDTTSRRVSETDLGPLFGDTPEPDDIQTGTIYVLRSQSSHPFVAEHRELIHKIGVTGGDVHTRIAAAAKDATYLLADVEVVATYALHNIKRSRLENIFHRLFAAAQLDLTIEDRFGQPVKPKEWFLLPLQVIDEAVQRIVDGTVTHVVYDPTLARLIDA